MNFNVKKRRVAAYRWVLLCVQVLFSPVLFLADYVPWPFAQIAYCVVVFTSPLLLLIYGFRYIREEDWYRAAVPFFAEAVLAFLFVGAMIYGIRTNMPGAALFANLLTIYIIDAALCVLGFFLISKH